MAHFVGDLSNPEHGTSDYNGWNISQGGLHNYFETEMVNAQPLLLDQEVYLAALNKKPFANVQKILPEAQRTALSDDPFAVAIAEALDARAHLTALTALDRKVSLLKPSRNDKGMNLKAERRLAEDVAPKFHDLLVERLSAGADTLAHLWESAWKKAGSPDLSGYQSYEYPVAPAFIKPDYLTPGAS